MKKRSWIVIALIVVLIAAALYAQKPPRNVSPQKHPNLAAAQKFLGQAYDKIVAAQAANEYDMNGHAAKAKALIEQADSELKLAAETANAKKG